MYRPVLFPLPGSDPISKDLVHALDVERGRMEFRRFPDSEVYLRYHTPLEGRDVIIVCGLDRPDDKILLLRFAAAAARDLGASKIGLICPYLAYMRQDKRFHPGEAITSAYFADMVSSHFDWLVTVDPHLHRRTSLSEIYKIPARALHAAPLLAEWVKAEVAQPLLIGPDSESQQWVDAIAQMVGAPSIVLEKIRRGDRDVEVSIPDVKLLSGHTPVLVDDIVSTARAMIEGVRHLKRAGARPVCLAIHGIFAGTAYEDLVAAGPDRVVTTDTVPHETNAIGVADLLAQASASYFVMNGIYCRLAESRDGT